MKVIYVRCAKERGYINIGVAAEEKRQDLTLTEREYADAGAPKEAEALSDETYNLLIVADMRYRARLKALRVLSYADNSELRLYRKLLSAGISREIATETVKEMCALGYINPDRQISAFIKNEVKFRSTGPRKITDKLIAKGYRAADIERVLDELVSLGEIDFERAKKELISTKLGSDASEDEIKKLLYKNGYYI